MKRRDLLKGIGALIGSTFIGRLSYAQEKQTEKVIAIPDKLLLPPSAKRAVIIGGGFAGSSLANTLRGLAPDAEVIVIEKNPFFVSGPSHIDFVVGLRTLEAASRGYDSLREKNIKIIKSEVSAIRPEEKRVYTAAGYIDYSQLIVASGIRLADEEILKLTERPAANAHAWELEKTLELKRRFDNFSGGRIVIAVPAPPFKCPPGPYEIACLLVDLYEKKKVKAEITIVDASDRPQPAPLAQKWLAVLEKKKINYIPNNKVIELDSANRQVITDKGEKIKYDLVSIIPPNKAATYIKDADLGDPFVDVDPGNFKSKKYDSIFAIGDCAKLPYTKSAYTANLQGRSAAHHVARAMGYEAKEPEPIHNICYPYTSPTEALIVQVEWDKEGKVVKSFVDDPKPEYRNAREVWESSLLWNTFGS